MRECVPSVLRWSEAVASLIGVRRPERKKTAAISRTTASHLDYFYEEVEEIMAELVVVVACLGVAPIAGDTRRRARPRRGHGGEKTKGERGSRRAEERGGGAPLILFAEERRGEESAVEGGPGGDAREDDNGVGRTAATGGRRPFCTTPPGLFFLFATKSFFLFLLFLLKPVGF